jgi:3-hydroxyacyl-CoA dehydrogenase
VYAKQIFRAPLLGEGAPSAASAGKTVFEDDSVRLWTLDSGLAAEVLLLSIMTKVHAIGPGVVTGLL